MNLLCDEGVDRPIVSYLREQGHSVFYVAELEPGVDDQFILTKSAELNAPLVTTDKDFGELVFRQKLTSAGVILLRLAGLTQDAKAKAVAAALQDHGSVLPGAFTVISPGYVRVRRAGPG